MSELRQFGEILMRDIRKDMNNYADDLANGVCRSFDEYQKLCGVIRGLAIAEQHLATLMKKVEESDE